ncbi:PspA/IM30 family protein [Thiosocius teredinicola]|uniref:PspA/IM30 family protein n=1 Tax=Thiosocius teredinicola TaxID=1973002 RepID=UPI000990A08F
MALITRVSRLFRADVNAVLDRIEEPEVLLKQSVREMAEALDADRQQAQRLDLEIKQLSTRETEAQQRLADIDEQLDLCFVSGNESLVRGLLKRKLESKRLLKFVLGKRDELRSRSQVLTARISENASRLESMQQKAALFAEHEAHDEVAEFNADSATAAQFIVTDEDVELELLRERQKRAPQ